MKELSIEEKAKRYDEALKRAKKLYAQGTITESLSYVFPELAESEDERVKNEIIAFVEQSIHRGGGTPIPQEQENKWITWLEKQGEQNPTDTVEPKFKVGDWLTALTAKRKIRKIIAVGTGLYVMKRKDGTEVSLRVNYVESNYRLWTIQDAKDGDVLVNDTGCIFIYKNKLNDIVLRDYCHLSTSGYILTKNDNEGGYIHITNVYPATKEQRYTLMKAMVDAGYTFDFDKKELKKIEQKPKKCIYSKDNYTDEDRLVLCDGCDEVCKLKQNPAWSEEDERMFNSALWHVKNSCGNGGKNSGEFEVYNWLKDLKDRVQPKQEWSEEYYNKIEAIAYHLDNIGNKTMAAVLRNIRDKYYHIN